MKPLSFTTKTKTVPVELNGEVYSLVEMTGLLRDEYLDTTKDRFKFNNEGKAAGISSFSGMQAELIVRTLKDGKGNFVSVDFVQSLPCTVTSALFDAAQELNNLGSKDEGKAEAEAKKA